jgi:hypothetical protein
LLGGIAPHMANLGQNVAKIKLQVLIEIFPLLGAGYLEESLAYIVTS